MTARKLPINSAKERCVRTYTRDARNRLTSIVAGLATVGSFQYDGFGRRATNGNTGFLYDGVNLVQEVTASTPTANLLTGLGVDEIFSRTDTPGSHHFLTDAQGNTLALTDSVGFPQTQYTYEPFGATTTPGAPNSNPYQYTGRENDGTGLYYYRTRYDSTYQRFISEDPARFRGGISFYSYAGERPA